MTVRNLPSALKTSLLNYEAYIPVHLIKFERPIANLGHSQNISKNPKDYVYLTDSSYPIEYQDGTIPADSTNISAAQTYYPAKISKIGTVNENIQAKAASLTLTLDASALQASTPALSSLLSGNTIVNDSFSKEAIAQGFQQGDKVLLIDTNNSTEVYAIIKKFRSVGIEFEFIGGSFSSNVITVSMKLVSEDLTSILQDKNTSSYTSFVNREVYIYKAHINPVTREIIGGGLNSNGKYNAGPFLYFKGIISKANLSEGLKSSTIKWTLTSHWGDFLKVQGRLTEDSSHRALKSDGTPDIDATIKEAYANDLGFLHANSAINQVATYLESVTKFKIRDKSGADWITGTETVEYEEDEERYINLSLNPKAKLLPVVYGVRKISGFPVFVDTDASDSTTVFKLDALCEGRVASILDIYVEDTPLICLDKNDFDVRNPSGIDFEEDKVEYRCYGSQEQGNTLSSYNANLDNLLFEEPEQTHPRLGYNDSYGVYQDMSFNVEATGAGAETGITHERTHTLRENTTAYLTFHGGLEHQKADNTLVSKAQNGGFKVQDSYYSRKEDYWSSAHKLLDTAYIVGQYKLGVGSTTLPELSYIIRGRAIECYNYDNSYEKSNEYTSTATISDFAIGAVCNIKHAISNTVLYSSVRIKDAWSFIDETGAVQYRFNFFETLDLESQDCYIELDSDNSKKWYLNTEDTSTTTGSVPSSAGLQLQISNLVSQGTTFAQSQKVTWDSTDTGLLFGSSAKNILDYYPDNSIIIGLVYTDTSDAGSTSLERASSDFNNYTYSTSGDDCTLDNLGSVAYSSSNEIASIIFKNILKLDTNVTYSSSIIGRKIKITTVSPVDDSATYEEKNILDYDSSTNTVLLDSPLSNTTKDTYVIESLKDRRVSLNPALQLLDYLTNIRYGKGLELEEIDLESFKEAARQCDTRSDITVLVPNTSVSNLAEDAVYVSNEWIGTVRKIETFSASFKQVTFTNCSGKLLRVHKPSYKFSAGQKVYKDNILYEVINTHTTGLISSEDFSSKTSVINAFSLNKISGDGPSSLPLDVSSTRVSANGNPVIKKRRAGGISGNTEGIGYSLYDSDDVKYWRYLGWDSSEQRNVTRHQFNQIVQTTSSVFNNINNMLKQFNGILRYSAGKYQLEVKGKKGIVDVAEQITADDIIGTITLDEGGLKSSKNSVSASIIDPANKFESRSISFFDSTYLKQDRGIKKTGNVSLDAITNYFNARLQIKQYLDQARHSATISFDMSPRGLLLTAGSIIELTYPRFGYNSKEFRIENLNFLDNGTVSVVAKEHSDETYLVDEVSKSLIVDEQVDVKNSPTGYNIPDRPYNLSATQNRQGEIVLSWTNAADFSPFTHTVEVYSNSVNNFSHGDTTFIGTSTSNTYHDIISEGSGGSSSRYYWIRYIVKTQTLFNTVKVLGSPYYPNTDDSSFTNGEGITGIGQLVNQPRILKLTAPTQNFTYNLEGNAVDDNYPSSTTITATTTNVTGSKTHVWERNGAPIGNESGATLNYTPPSSYTDMPEIIKCTMTETIGDITITAVDEINITASKLVVNGTNNLQFLGEGYAVEATAGTFNFDASSTGTIGSTSSFASTFTISKIVDGTSTNYLYNNAADAGSGTFKYGTATNVFPVGAVSTSIGGGGEVQISAASGSFLTGTSITQAVFDLPIIDNGDGATISVFRFVLTKSLSGVDSIQKALVYAYTSRVAIPTGVNANPGAVTVSLSNGEITTDLSNNIWKKNIDDLTGVKPIYIVAATATGTGSTDTITANEWSDPVRVFSQSYTARLLLSKNSFFYDDQGDVEANQSACQASAFLADTNVPEGTIYYDFVVQSGSTVITSQNTTSNTVSFSAPSTHSVSPITVSLAVRLGSTTGSVISEDGGTVSLLKNGLTPDALTIDSYSTSNGTTSINFNNGQSVEITGATKGVKPLYAASTNPTQWSDVSETQGTNEYVNFYEYTGVFSDLSDQAVTALTFVKIVGEDGDNEGVIPIYANSVGGTAGEPTSKSFTASSTKKYINFYEWTGSPPISIPTGLTYLKYLGDAGNRGLNAATVFIYKRTSSSTETTKPAGNTTYRFVDAGAPSTLKAGDVTFTSANGWSATPPTGSNKYLWYRTASALTTFDTDYIGSSEWSEAQLLSVNGNDGNSSSGIRGSMSVFLEESEHSTINNQIVEDFVEDGTNTFNGTAAQAVAALMMTLSSDGFIRPGDKVTVTDNSHNLAGTRIYNSTSATNNTSTVGTSSFSSLVVEHFPGSVIVDGTLDAGKLISNTVISNNIKVNSQLELQNSGKIFTTNKASYTTDNAGFFLGYTGGQYKLNLGNSTNYLKWDGTTLDIKGDVEVNSIDADDVTITNLNAYHITGGINRFQIDRDTTNNYINLTSSVNGATEYQWLVFPTELIELEDGTFRTFSRRIHAQISGWGYFFTNSTYKFTIKIKSGNTPDWTRSVPTGYTPTTYLTNTSAHFWRVRVTGNVVDQLGPSSFIRNQNGKILGFASTATDGGPQYVSSGNYTKFIVRWNTGSTTYSTEPVASDFTGTLESWEYTEDTGEVVAEIFHRFAHSSKPQQFHIQGGLESYQDSLCMVVVEVERYNNASDYTKPTTIYTESGQLSGTDDRIAEVVSFISEIR